MVRNYKTLYLLFALVLSLSACNESTSPASESTPSVVVKQPVSSPAGTDDGRKADPVKVDEITAFKQLVPGSTKVTAYSSKNLKKMFSEFEHTRGQYEMCQIVAKHGELRSVLTHKKIGEAGSFNFYYEVYKADPFETRPNGRIIFFLRGGPGGQSIGMESEAIKKLVNAGYTIIKFDQRGFGCNTNDKDVSDVTIDIEHIAYDILRVIQAESLNKFSIGNNGERSNKPYGIYGHSFGTVYGNVLLNKLSGKYNFLPQPKFAVMSGAVGKSLSSLSSYIENRVRVINDILEINPYVKNVLKNSDSFEFLGSESDPRRAFLMGMLVGVCESGLEIEADSEEAKTLSLFQELNNYLEKDEPISFRTKTDLIQIYSSVEGALGEKFDQQYIGDHTPNKIKLGCDLNNDHYAFLMTSSIEPDDGYNFVVKDMEQVTDYSCVENGHTNPAFFDSKKFQTTIPTVFFHGTHDASASPEGARYYAENQVNKNNNLFIEIEDAGHIPLSLSLNECVPSIFDKLYETQTKIPDLSELIDDSGRCK